MISLKRPSTLKPGGVWYSGQAKGDVRRDQGILALVERLTFGKRHMLRPQSSRGARETSSYAYFRWKNSMTALITGATGLIGLNLLRTCIRQDILVHFLTTRSSKLIQTDNHRGFLWNPKNNEIDDQCFNGVDTIVHLVGAPISEPWTKAYRQEIVESRVGTMMLLEESLSKLEHQVTHFISASGISLYPNSLQHITQDSTVGDNFLRDSARRSF